VSRLLYIDWMRGLAVLFMVLWHTADAWTLPAERQGLGFDAVLFLAGWAAPLFLFLAGLSVPLAGDARERRGMTRAEASRTLQRRGWQVFLLAHLFRVQSFLLNPNGSWSSIFKPDILNILGLGLVVTAVLWKRVRSPRDAALWLLGPAVVCVAVLTPLSREWWWPTLLHPRLEAYIRPVGNFGVFSMFPTIGYVLAGAFAGVLVSLHRDAPGRTHRVLGVMGAGLVLAGGAGTFIPSLGIPTPTESAPFVMWRTGAMMAALAAAGAVFARLRAERRGTVVLLGQTSLFVYWVHVEIAYGVFSYPIRHGLTLTQSLAAYAAFMLVLTGLAAVWDGRRRGPLIPAHMRVPRPASGVPGRHSVTGRLSRVPQG
jgi:uncharacterized membrane protein